MVGKGTVSVADAAQLQQMEIGDDFTGGIAVSDGNLEFTYENGAFTPSLIMQDRDLSFSGAPVVKVNGTLAAGDHVLVSGKTLSGLENCTLDFGRTARLVKEGNELILRVIPGTQVIIR